MAFNTLNSSFHRIMGKSEGINTGGSLAQISVSPFTVRHHRTLKIFVMLDIIIPSFLEESSIDKFFGNQSLNFLQQQQKSVLEHHIMKNNKSAASLNLTQSINVRQIASPTNKKIEGFDKTAFTSTFSSKIDKLKNKPKTQALEDQYIKGLQDQIKYLQMELKLLQEKDIEKHGQIDQLEKFFGDGIPINENILAIKNGFNNYKSSNQKKIKELSTEKQERITLIDGLTHKIDKMLAELNENEKTNRSASKKNDEQWFSLVGKEASLKHTIEKEEEEMKGLKMNNRKIFQKIQKMTRNKLIDNISVIKYENNKNIKLNALKESIAQKQALLLELEKQYGTLLKEQQEKSFIIRLEEENLSQRKKIISYQRDNDNLKSKIKEKTVQLEEKLKERMTELQSKLNMKNKVEDLKEAINRQNSLTVESVIEHAKEKQIEHLRKIIDNNKKCLKYTDHYSNLLSNIESSIQSLAQRKPQAKSEISAYTQDVLRLKKRIQQEKQREIKMHAELVQLQEKFDYNKELITPLQEKTKKNNEMIQSYLQERHRLVQEIKIKEKQLQLIFVLKELNFDEVEISKTSNKNIQEQLLNFLKSWDKIQRNT